TLGSARSISAGFGDKRSFLSKCERFFVLQSISLPIKTMRVDSLEKVVINDSEQWILVRGKSSKAPLILHVQAGPGLPIIPEARAMEKKLNLETDYLVAYWDQRACGK